MEDESAAAQPALRRSKRARAPIRPADFFHSDESDEESEEISDEFPERRRKVKRKKVSAAAVRNLSLIEAIKGEGKDIPAVVKRWVGKYERNQKSALAELLTMLFEACGAKYPIAEEDIDKINVEDVVAALDQMARKEVEDYQSLKRNFKNFKDNLVYFWDNVVSKCLNGTLFDQSLFDRCLDYIIALSCACSRTYRQIASLVGLQLVTSFINVAKMLDSQSDTTHSQLTAEKEKNIEGPRVESLTKRLSMIQEKITTMEEIIKKVFTELFKHRYQDIDPDIRMSCTESLGMWVLSYPSLFLHDEYLKYLGWALDDKSAGVRKASLLALQNLYEVEDNVSSLYRFTEEFYEQILELARENDISVSLCAMGLVKQLLRYAETRELIPDEELGLVYDLLIDDQPEVRHAVGALVYDDLIAQKSNDSKSGPTGRDSDSSELHISRMLRILKVFSTDPIMSSYVIDDVWDYMEAMKDWKCIIRMLLADNQSAEFDDVDATNLVRLLFASVRKAVGERIVPATDSRNLHHTKAEQEMFEKNKRSVTVAVMSSYPQLLRKFMPDKDKVAPLVEIIVRMDLEHYSCERQEEEQNIRAILKLLREAFFRHWEKDNLRACVKAINFFSTESQGELRNFVQNQVKELENELVAKFKSAIEDVVNGGDVHSLLVNLKRLYELQLSHKVPLDGLYQDLVHILRSFRNIDDEIIAFLLLNMFLIVSWCLHSILSSETVSEADLYSLSRKRDALLEELEYFIHNPFELLGHGRSKTQLAYRVCGMLADIWCLFKRTKFALSKLGILGYCPDEFVISKYWRMCEPLLNDSDDAEDEEGNREYVEETNPDMVMFALAKLVVTDSVPAELLAPEIISHLEKYGESVAEIVKHLLTTLKKKGDISNILVEALKRAYQRHLAAASSGNDKQSSKTFQECKDLAARLSGSYVGFARNKYKSEISNIARHGVNYAFSSAPKQLSFLNGVVLYFVSKLPAPDMLDIMRGVESRAKNASMDEDRSGWRPYHMFLDTLREKYLKNGAVKVADGSKEGTNARRRRLPRKQQNVQGRRLFDEQSSNEEEDSISGYDKDAVAEVNQE